MDITMIKHRECTGCSACFNICPVNAIEMIVDREGFIKPIIHEEKCVSCEKCYKICPAVNEVSYNKSNQKCTALMADKEVREKSSSGGMFTLLSKIILSKGGAVVGAAWDDNLDVKHIVIQKEEEMDLLRGSKYIQSNIGDSYKLVKNLLEKNIQVLFSGCPCQIAGLKGYLGKEYDNLYLIDIICHGVASKKILDSYVQTKSKGKKVEKINFRDKSTYKWSTSFSATIEDKIVRESYEESKFLNAFKEGLIFRESCYKCKYAKDQRVGDLSIGDFWGIWNYDAKMNDGMGTSLVMVNSSKGEKLYDEIKHVFEKDISYREDIPVEFAAKYNGNIRYPAVRNESRSLFIGKLNNMNFYDAYEYIKNNHYDVGIVGYWYATNYGSVITYYALYKAIERLGYRPLLIDRPEKEKDPEGLDVFSRRFLEERVAISKSIKWYELEKIDDMCKTFVVGSDQVWTPGAIKHMGFFFFLSFICDDKKKIAYAPSFGQSNFKATPETIRKVKYFGGKFDAISVREVDGVNICDEIFNLKAERVLDPVFLIENSDYDEIASTSYKHVSGDYIATYILDPTEDKRKMLLEASEQLNMPLINMLDGRFNTFEKNSKKLNLPNTIYNLDAEDWVYYIKNAKYVITDSHHGLAMAIIYNKQFICYANQSRGQSRFTSLLNLLGLTDRMVFSSDEIKNRDLLNLPIDYKWVNIILKREKEKSISWLKAALEKEKREIPSDYDIAIRTSKEEINRKYQLLNNKIKELEEKIKILEEKNE